MTEEELEKEREEQRAKGQIPKYSGAHSNLTEEQIAAFERKEENQVFVSVYRIIKHIRFMILFVVIFHLNQVILVIGSL